ncbi:MAG: VOC family protein [Bacteroidia bacterium]
MSVTWASPASAGHSFNWSDGYEGKENKGCTAWTTFSEGTKHFGDGPQEFMINYRVDDLKGLLEALQSEGVTVLGEIAEYELRQICSYPDRDGRKVELWEPAGGDAADARPSRFEIN